MMRNMLPLSPLIAIEILTMRFLFFYFGLFFSFFMALALQAEEKSSAWHEKVSLGGEIRLRNETQLNYGPLTGGINDDSFMLLRARIHLDVKPTEGLQIFLQPQFSRAFAQEESTIAGNVDVANPNNVFDLHQGYLDLNKIGGSLVSLRIGRQELAYGEERLVGVFGWSNIGRSFDAGKMRLEWQKFWVDGFFAWNESAAGNEYFSGIHGSWKVRPTMTFDGYTLLLWDNDGDGTPGIAGTKIVTIGDRLAGTCLNDHIDYGIEAAIQIGKTEPNNHLAHALHTATGYTFDTSWKPRLGVEYNLASGDDPNTSRVERFHNLFPTNHDKYGLIDFASWRNIHDIVGSVSIKPLKDFLLKTDYHLFFLPEPADGMFRSNGNQLRAGTATASRFAGQEIDLLAKYMWNQWVTFLMGYSFFKGGEFFNNTGTNGTAHFTYAQVQTSF